jgi:serine/threonine protein kinase
MDPKLLAAGGYGCVFRPRIGCDGTSSRDANQVTKVQAADHAAKNEVAIGALVRSIPGHQRFFGAALESCAVSTTKVSAGILKQCPLVQKEKKLMFITFDYIPNVSMQTVANAALERREDIYALLHSYSLLLRNVSKLIDVGVAHLDLKQENILYDAIYHLPVIIDFGIAVNMNTLSPARWTQVFYTFSPDYYIWTPEVHYIAYLLHVNPNPGREEVELFSMAVMSNNKALDDFSMGFRNMWASACSKYFQQFIGKPRDVVIETLLSQWKTWDNYALSVMYLRLFQRWHADGYTSNPVFRKLTELFLWGLQPNPVERYTVQKSLSEYNQIFMIDAEASCVVSDLDAFAKRLKRKPDPV